MNRQVANLFVTVNNIMMVREKCNQIFYREFYDITIFTYQGLTFYFNSNKIKIPRMSQLSYNIPYKHIHVHVQCIQNYPGSLLKSH